MVTSKDSSQDFFTGEYSRDYTRDFEGNYSRNYTREFTGDYTGDYTREFVENVQRTSNYSRTFVGNYAKTSQELMSPTIQETLKVHIHVDILQTIKASKFHP